MASDSTIQRVLPSAPAERLADAADAGAGLRAARDLDPGAVIDVVDASGLRGRGGAGFPAGRKWRSVAAFETPGGAAPSVVVNAAEGEPGCFKDRSILRADPYRVLEGALIAAHAVGATKVDVVTNRSYSREIARLRRAVDEIVAAGWAPGIALTVIEGPGEYLLGEETGLLEAVDGRPPFPRLAPPYRRGIDEVPEPHHHHDPGSDSPADLELASLSHETDAPPALVSNVETFANVPGILARGADWFRELGTAESPGTVVCTLSGAVRRHGVGEFALGTPLATVIEELGGGALDGRTIVAVMSGVANALLPADLLGTPLTYEAMQAAGSGLGACGFIVWDDSTDPVAIAAGVARFLAVESCGQCRHCKQDGLIIADTLRRLAASNVTAADLDDLQDRLASVAEGARCNLAGQQETVVGSILRLFPDDVAAHADRRAGAVVPETIVPIADLVDGRAVPETRQADKQPDWSFEAEDSGQWPADRLDDPRRPRAL